APDGVVGRRPMRLQCGLVPVDFVEIVDVLVLCVLKDVEAHAARLIPLGAERVHLDRLQEALALLWPHSDLHPHRQHAASLLTATLASPGAACAPARAVPDAAYGDGGAASPANALPHIRPDRARRTIGTGADDHVRPFRLRK